MTKNIDEILQLTVEEFVIKGCTEGLKTRDYFKIKNTLLKYEEYEDNPYYKKLKRIVKDNYFLQDSFNAEYIYYVMLNSSLLPFVLANNTHDKIRLYSTDSFMFLCQFHNEETPSLGLTNHVNLMYCFGCGYSGNVFDYVKDYENISFKEALSLVAKVYNLEDPDIKVNKDLIDKYKQSIMSDKYLELIELGMKRIIDRSKKGVNKYDSSAYRAIEAYNKNLNQIHAVINNITPGISPVHYSKEKIYTKAYLDASYLE